MGVKSTFNIDRPTTLSIILSKINCCSNEQLANLLEELDDNGFRNFIVYDTLPDMLDDDDYYRQIRSINDF